MQVGPGVQRGAGACWVVRRGGPYQVHQLPRACCCAHGNCLRWLLVQGVGKQQLAPSMSCNNHLQRAPLTNIIPRPISWRFSGGVPTAAVHLSSPPLSATHIGTTFPPPPPAYSRSMLHPTPWNSSATLPSHPSSRPLAAP